MTKKNKKSSNLDNLSKKNREFSNLNELSKEKSFDAVRFKRQLHENSWRNSGAKNLHEYVKYVNKNATKSKLHRGFKNE